MKIVHVIASIDPKNGGLQAVAMRLAAAQAAMGSEVHIVAYGSEEAHRQVIELGEAIPGFSDVRLHVLTLPGRFESIFCIQGKRRLRQLFPGTSFIHIHGIWEPFLLYASKLAGKIPYCVCPAGMLDHWSLAQKRWKKKIALRLCYSGMLNNAAFIHVLNIDELRTVKPLGFRAPNIIIPNGVFPDEFDPLPAKDLFRAQIGLPQERRYILFLSRLHFKKGLDILADAFAVLAAQHPDVDLVVAGPADGAEAGFTALIERHGLGGRVHMTGPIYGDTKLAAIVEADCFCLPSRQEGFSMAILEGLACATPVVISDQCHFPEVAAAQAGMVVTLDPVEVAKGLDAILGDRILARQMGENGRRMIFETFTWPRIADMTLRAYEASACAAPASGRRARTGFAGFPT
ncbi:glycosyltransferase [Rhizobium sp. NFR03]|uniref:glycosyltransferase n=1 Tax=Rhizobium sp. NFR03 TaxID=1566263 RepID=UPI0008C79FB1|nr:glycosyltransferase [Rhizobium sp. NFR03]SES42128.1 Glycosyltransferase involved in cell wall bisynthesis [Rhizobium sp. NFR03]